MYYSLLCPSFFTVPPKIVNDHIKLLMQYVVLSVGNDVLNLKIVGIFDGLQVFVSSFVNSMLGNSTLFFVTKLKSIPHRFFLEFPGMPTLS